MPRKKLFFVSKLGTGHVNLPIAIIKTIQREYKDRFEFYFAVNQEFKSIIEKRVDNVNFLIFNPKTTDGLECLQKARIEWFYQFGETWKERELVKFNLIGGHPYWKFMRDCREYYPYITEMIQQIKPDLIFVDNLMTSPLAIDQNIPYVLISSTSPTLFGDRKLPPPRSGLPGDYTEDNLALWNDFIEKVFKHEDYLKFMNETNAWLKETKSPVNLDQKYYAQAPSPYLNIYNYPEEIDYEKMDGNWIRMDSAVTDTPEPFSVPQKLQNLPGLLIYFSLGSISACYAPLMNRLLHVLSELPHRFIVSTGPKGDQYELSENQYGEIFVNQLAVLQTVEIFITHGGNNSLTEAFHFGVPMISFGLFGDQHDNSKRIEEKGCGKKFDPFTCTKQDIEEAIQFCSSKEVKERCQKISQRIKKNNNLKNVCKSVVDLLE